VRADPSRVVDVAPLDPQDAFASSLACRATGGATVNRRRGYCSSRPRRGSRVRLPAAVRVAIDDLLSDLTPAARRFLDVVAVGRSAARVAAVEAFGARDADACSAGFDVALAELLEIGLVVMSSERLRVGVPIVGEAVAAQLGTGRAARRVRRDIGKA
jgi:hypothetical protein